MNTDLTPEPTPRVDSALKQEYGLCGEPNDGMFADFARGLERELLAAHKETAERGEALNTIADELQLPTGSTPDQIAVSVRNELARGIHTCSDSCQRPYCVLKREKEALSGALREEQLKIQALIEAINWALKPEYLLSCDLLMSNPPKNASVWCIQSHLRSALGEQPTRP